MLLPALPLKAATSIIPIVLTIGDDPVKYGLGSVFQSNPGGNITGYHPVHRHADAEAVWRS